MAPSRNLPNLERIAQLITAGRLEEVLYTSPTAPASLPNA